MQTALSIPTQPIYRPGDVAKVLGLTHAAVTHHVRTRPKLFPDTGNGWFYDWTPAQLPRVLLTLLTLSSKARRHVRAQIADSARAQALSAHGLMREFFAEVLCNPCPNAPVAA